MVEDTQDDALAALRADELDCAFTALDPDALGDEFAAKLLWKEEIVVALPLGHPLADGSRVTFEQLAAEDLIAYRENSALRCRLERTMADRGLTSKGLGVAVTPRRTARAADRAGLRAA